MEKVVRSCSIEKPLLISYNIQEYTAMESYFQYCCRSHSTTLWPRTPLQVLPYEFYEIFQGSHFTKHLWTVTSKIVALKIYKIAQWNCFLLLSICIPVFWNTSACLYFWRFPNFWDNSSESEMLWHQCWPEMHN